MCVHYLGRHLQLLLYVAEAVLSSRLLCVVHHISSIALAYPRVPRNQTPRRRLKTTLHRDEVSVQKTVNKRGPVSCRWIRACARTSSSACGNFESDPRLRMISREEEPAGCAVVSTGTCPSVCWGHSSSAAGYKCWMILECALPRCHPSFHTFSASPTCDSS